MQPIYSKQATKYLEKLSKNMSLRLVTAINKLPDGDVKKLRGFNSLYRLRVGDLRVTFTQDNGQIVVEEINSRGRIYKMGVVL